MSRGDGAAGCCTRRGASPLPGAWRRGQGKAHAGSTGQTGPGGAGVPPHQMRGRCLEAPVGEWRQDLGPRAPDRKGAGPGSCPPSGGPAEWPPRGPGVVLTHPSSPWPTPPHSPLPRRLLRPGPCTWWLPAGRGVSPGSWAPEWRSEEARSVTRATFFSASAHLGTSAPFCLCPPQKSWHPQQMGWALSPSATRTRGPRRSRGSLLH